MLTSGTIFPVLADRGGAAAVEFALLAPALVLFVVGTIDLGTLAYQSLQVRAAVHAGALYALKNAPSPTAAAIDSAVQNATTLTVTPTAPTPLYYCDSGGSLSSVGSPTSSCSGGTVGTYLVVSAQATFTPPVTWSALGLPSTISSQAMVRVQ